MLKTQLTVIPLLVFSIFSTVNDFHKELPQPVIINKEEVGKTRARIALEILGAPKERIEKLSHGVYVASIATNIDPVLIASIMKSESGFHISAVSPKKYKGLMQAPRALMIWEYAEVDILYGAMILKEKLQIAKGNIDRAMIFYKGHGGKESQDIAAKQMSDYRALNTKVNERINRA